MAARDRAGAIYRLLERPHDVAWSLQGLGMLRTYLTPRVRLHVWDPQEATPEVSTIHDHPWNFTSEIVSGALTNARYLVGGPEVSSTHYMASIVCGPGGGMQPGKPTEVALMRCMAESYIAGMVYSQRASELHESMPYRGCVTLVTREFLSNTEIAHVAWPVGTTWGSAEPRPATFDEVQRITRVALENWTA